MEEQLLMSVKMEVLLPVDDIPPSLPPELQLEAAQKVCPPPSSQFSCFHDFSPEVQLAAAGCGWLQLCYVNCISSPLPSHCPEK